MPIQIACPHCLAKLNGPDSLAGKHIKCPKCGQLAGVPQATEPPSTLWHVRLSDGGEYGPVPRTELDEWFREGRITDECGLRKEGGGPWRRATEVYPSLAPHKPLVPLPDDLDTLPAYVEPEPIRPFATSGSNAVHSLPPAPDGAPSPLPPPPEFSEETGMQRVGWFVAILPVVICCLEMADGWGLNNFKLSPFIGFPIVMLAGMLGGAMIGRRYFLPGAIGGFFANLGAAIATVVMLNQVNWTSNVVLAIVGFVGAMPGIGVFFVLKWLQDAIFPQRT